MRILFTGNYDPNYNRTLIIKQGLIQAGQEISEFPFKYKNSSNAKRLRKYMKDSDIVFMPCFTHKEVGFVKKNIDRPLVYDPLISRFLTKVFDYKSIYRLSFSALKNFLVDRKGINSADLVFADTLQHLNYFRKISGAKAGKFSVLPVGVIANDFYPQEKKLKDNVFTVGYYGGFIPLHGVDKIIEAAQILKSNEDVHFHLAGSGYDYKRVGKRLRKLKLTNITLSGWIKYERLNQLINSFDICLGIFGDTPKAKKVIPNKIYHYTACKKAVITLDTPAIKEVFTNNEDILLCNGDSRSLAEKIIKLKEDKQLRDSLAEKAFTLITEKFNEDKVAELFLSAVKNRFPELNI